MADEKYVVHGMRVKCSEGSMENYINTDTGHGVVYQGQPVLNANDHAKEVNLTHFGDCKSKLIFEEAKKQADEKYKAEEGDGFFAKLGKGIAKTVTKAVISVKETFASNKCELETPLPWIFTSRDHMIDGAPVLTTESQCACKFGGIITIVPQEEEAADESSPEVVEVNENVIPLAATIGKSDSNTTAEAALAAVVAGIAAVPGMPGAAAAGLAGAAKVKQKDAGKQNIEEEKESKENDYFGRYPKAFIEGIIKAYETHKIVNGRFVLDNNGQTIGYGHDVLDGEDFSKGLNEKEALNLLINDLDAKYKSIKGYIEALNTNYGFSININNFSENELLFLIDFSFNRGAGLVKRSELEKVGKPYSSLAILIVAVSEKDDNEVIKTLMEETKNLKGVYYEGLKLRRMDEYEILKFGDFERDYDVERDYAKSK